MAISNWRPPHLFAPINMEVQMIDGLASVWSDVRHDPVAVFQTKLFRQLHFPVIIFPFKNTNHGDGYHNFA